LTGVKIPNFNIDKNADKREGTDKSTIILPLMFMHQLDRKGKSVYTHAIEHKMIFDDEGEMLGVTVSHPGAKSDGILLYGKTRKNGTIDDKDPDTYAALTVNTDAIIIGMDEKGMYGEVYSPHARVYKLSKDKKRELIPYGSTFSIEDGTYICIGNQWLYFEEPEIPKFPFDITGEDAVSDVIDFDTPPVAAGKSKRGMRKRGSEAEPVAKAPCGAAEPEDAHTPTARYDHRAVKPEGAKKLSYRFPMDE
jgi:hypothetical protein